MPDSSIQNNIYYLIRAVYSEEAEKDPTKSGFYTYDVTSFTAVRNALGKTASYYIITLNIPVEYYIQLNQLISIGSYPDMYVELYLVDERTRTSEFPLGSNILKKPIFKRTLTMMYMEPLEAVTFESRHIHTLIIMSNPLLFFLSRHLTYTKPLSGRAYDALKTFERYLETTYTDMASKVKPFEFVEVLNDKMITPYKYGTILTRGLTGDIQIPRFLITWYKVTQTPSLYFFDDFRYDDDSENPAEIYGYLINFADIDQFDDDPVKTDLRDMTKLSDIGTAVNFIGSVPMASPNLKLNRGITDLLIHDYSMHLISTRPPKNQLFPSPHLNLKKSEIEEYLTPSMDEQTKRRVAIKEMENNLMIDPKVRSALNIYTPDTDKLAVERFDLTRELVTKYLVAIETYSFTNTYFQFFQFGRLYNLTITDTFTPDNENKHFHTPGCILNIFHRTAGSESLLIHTARVQFVKIREGFKLEEEKQVYTMSAAVDVGSVIEPKEKPKDKTEEDITSAIDLSKLEGCNDKLRDPAVAEQVRKAILARAKACRHLPDDCKQYFTDKVYEGIAKLPNPMVGLLMIEKETSFCPRKGPKDKAGYCTEGLIQVQYDCESGVIRDSNLRRIIGNADNLNPNKVGCQTAVDNQVKSMWYFSGLIEPNSWIGRRAREGGNSWVYAHGGAVSESGKEFVRDRYNKAYNSLDRTFKRLGYDGIPDLSPSDEECKKAYNKYSLSFVPQTKTG